MVADSARADQVTLDEHYELTAFVVQRSAGATAQTIVGELLDRGAEYGTDRSTVSAYDELHDRTTGLITGSTAAEVVAKVCWSEL